MIDGSPRFSGDSENGELVVYYFGRGGAGGARANVERWIGQFESKERKAKFFKGKSSTGSYALVDVTGTFNKPVGPPIRRQSKALPGARMLAVYQETPSGPYYLKFTGPQKTITAAAASFRHSFGADPESETEVKAGDL